VTDRLTMRVALWLALVTIFRVATASAQFQMPDPKEMSGIPRPVTDLPDRTVSVRVIRGDLSKNIANQEVELTIDGKPRTAKTDENGRAEFGGLPSGTVKAATTVDGERLESQEFPAPERGGIRLMLVATDKEKEAQATRDAAAPAVTGNVILGGETRIVIEPDDDSVRVYYLLDIQNTARAKVNPETPFQFDAPTGAGGVTLMEGSSPLASVTGPRVRVNGPFPSGTTFVQIGFVLPLKNGTLELTQPFPAAFDHLGVIVKKVGNAKLSSPLIERQQDMPAGSDVYIAAAGGGVPVGKPVTLTVSGLPHHSSAPRNIAIALAALVVVAGIWLGRAPAQGSPASERKELIARRERLFHDLVRLETDRRRGKGDSSRYRARREELVSALEHVYGALDTSHGPDPGRPGLAA
jgi:hypothetical protein